MSKQVDRRAFLRMASAATLGSVLCAEAVTLAVADVPRNSKAGADAVAAVPISLIGLPYLMGTRALNTMYGMAQGPVVLLAPDRVPAAFRGYFQDVEVQMIDNVDEPEPPLPRGDQMARILTENIALADAVRKVRARGRLPIISIGTCSATLGVLGGLSDIKEDIGLFWFDAHSDAQTPATSQSGFIEGMVVPMIAGTAWPRYSARIPGFRTIPEDRIVQVSLGSTTWPIPPDSAALGTPVHKLVIDRLGVQAALGPAIEKMASKCKKVFIHMDADTIDPKYYRNFKARPDITGMSPDQVMQSFELISKHFEIVALDVGAFDPTCDPRAPGILSTILLSGAKDAAGSKLRNSGA